MRSDHERVVAELHAAGVPGAGDFGRFVSNTEFFRPSELDERAAMPVLVELLPSLRDDATVAAVAGHLRRPWARPFAYTSVAAAFVRWAPTSPLGAGWQLGDAVGTTAPNVRGDEVVGLVEDASVGQARQMIVHALWRFRRFTDVEPVLVRLLDDEDVALHAMSALQRTIGRGAVVPYLQHLADRAAGTARGREATRRLKRLAT